MDDNSSYLDDNHQNHPKSLSELFDFYYDRVKPLYTRALASNDLPVELLFETLAALDHLSRHENLGMHGS